MIEILAANNFLAALVSFGFCAIVSAWLLSRKESGQGCDIITWGAFSAVVAIAGIALHRLYYAFIALFTGWQSHEVLAVLLEWRTAANTLSLAIYVLALTSFLGLVSRGLFGRRWPLASILALAGVWLGAFALARLYP